MSVFFQAFLVFSVKKYSPCEPNIQLRASTARCQIDRISQALVSLTNLPFSPASIVQFCLLFCFKQTHIGMYSRQSLLWFETCQILFLFFTVFIFKGTDRAKSRLCGCVTNSDMLFTLPLPYISCHLHGNLLHCSSAYYLTKLSPFLIRPPFVASHLSLTTSNDVVNQTHVSGSQNCNCHGWDNRLNESLHLLQQVFNQLWDQMSYVSYLLFPHVMYQN